VKAHQLIGRLYVRRREVDHQALPSQDVDVKSRVLALAVLVVLGIMPAAQASQRIDYRGPLGDATIRLTVVKRDSGRRFIVAEAVKGVSGTCEGGGEFGGGLVAFGLNVRVRGDRPFRIDIAGLGGGDILFHTEGNLGWRQGQGTLTHTAKDSDGNPCTTGELDWTVERVVQA
jgi:hypothetical protein